LRALRAREWRDLTSAAPGQPSEHPLQPSPHLDPSSLRPNRAPVAHQSSFCARRENLLPAGECVTRDRDQAADDERASPGDHKLRSGTFPVLHRGPSRSAQDRALMTSKLRHLSHDRARHVPEPSWAPEEIGGN
jgi:hypothetical protein